MAKLRTPFCGISRQIVMCYRERQFTKERQVNKCLAQKLSNVRG